tara:strand:- start:5533 stop:6375 length:843 start_codon:yes stop_codon:yes gene_type:complete
MEFKNGYSIKPKYVTSVGEVIFTDGTNEVRANQITCEDYGYIYNASTGTCSSFRYNTKINITSNNAHNIIKGSLNTTNLGTENSFILGVNNTSSGNNQNILISGTKNEIDNGLNNTSIIGGSLGVAKNQGEVVIAGNGFNEQVGLSQQSFIQQSNKTLDATETALLTQYLPLTYIQKVKNSVIGFEANIIGINYGGEGEVGEYGYVQLTGAVKFTNGLASTYHQTSTHIVTSGQSGMNISAEMKDVTATSFGVHVTGIAGTRIQWTASIKLWQNQLQITF